MKITNLPEQLLIKVYSLLSDCSNYQSQLSKITMRSCDSETNKESFKFRNLTVICEEISGYLGLKVRSILIQDTVPRNEISFNWNKEK